LRELSVFEV